ncbi:MAG TPA: hypothetical protein VKB72_10350 [Steroidobacteraceae bacterium]|nr:hypothetical protein [Steroidobacteraceae bacterium]
MKVTVITLVAPLAIVAGEKLMPEMTGGLGLFCAVAGNEWTISNAANASKQSEAVKLRARAGIDDLTLSLRTIMNIRTQS